MTPVEARAWSVKLLGREECWPRRLAGVTDRRSNQLDYPQGGRRTGDSVTHLPTYPAASSVPTGRAPRLAARTMISRALRVGCTAVVGLFALSLFVDVAAAANPSAQGLIDDAYDNGRIDSTWNCDATLDALALLPQQRRPGYFAALAGVEQHLRVRCAGRRNAPAEPALYSAVDTPSYTQPTSPVLDEATYDSVGATLALPEQSAEVGVGDSDDLLPWDIVIIGIVAGVLVVFGGAAALGQFRLRL